METKNTITVAQANNLAALRAAGAPVTKSRSGWRTLAGVPVSGLNANALRSLRKLGLISGKMIDGVSAYWAE